MLNYRQWLDSMGIDKGSPIDRVHYQTYTENFMSKNNYNKNRSNNSYQKDNNYTKHSGAKRSKIWYPKDGPNKGMEMKMTYGWHLANGLLISVKAVLTGKSHLSEKGWWGSVAVTFTNTKTGEKNFHWGTMQDSTGKVVIDSLSHVLNPQAPNGGYSGTYNR